MPESCTKHESPDYNQAQLEESARLYAEVYAEDADLRMLTQQATLQIASDEALRIARLDAELAYGDVSGYRVTVLLRNGEWCVDYDLPDPFEKGGGAHYKIDSASGQIVSKT
jgi:hypothetical protein